jgi:hypothetical protein
VPLDCGSSTGLPESNAPVELNVVLNCHGFGSKLINSWDLVGRGEKGNERAE